MPARLMAWAPIQVPYYMAISAKADKALQVAWLLHEQGIPVHARIDRTGDAIIVATINNTEYARFRDFAYRENVGCRRATDPQFDLQPFTLKMVGVSLPPKPVQVSRRVRAISTTGRNALYVAIDTPDCDVMRVLEETGRAYRAYDLANTCAVYVSANYNTVNTWKTRRRITVRPAYGYPNEKASKTYEPEEADTGA